MEGTDLSVRRRGPVLALAGLVVAGALVVVLLVTAGPEAPFEPRGDLHYVRGSVKREHPAAGELAASVADIVDADIRMENDDLIFHAELAAPVPRRLAPSSLELRWQVTTGDNSEWTISATLVRELEAAIFSSSSYGSGTVDGSMPGKVLSQGSTITIALDPFKLDDFPDTFEWRLFTLLRVFANEPDSDRVEDVAPDKGRKRFP